MWWRLGTLANVLVSGVWCSEHLATFGAQMFRKQNSVQLVLGGSWTFSRGSEHLKVFWTFLILFRTFPTELCEHFEGTRTFWTLISHSWKCSEPNKKMCFLCSEHLKTQKHRFGGVLNTTKHHLRGLSPQTIPIAWQSGLFQQAQLTWKGVKVNRLPYSLRSNGFRGANY